ncbi:MAG: M20/M25/M40 family metallo-hydrolase [Gemmatimonadaceae bacterium]|nr:M20/M25/M40 family metallo-hydrolase [Gemmatimonadaceae bacterium]
MPALSARAAALSCALALAAALPLAAQSAPADRLIDGALKDSAAWNRLAELVDTYGNRPAGSANLESAIDWIVAQMKKDGLDNVHTEPVMVPHWVRGRESAMLLSPHRVPLHMLGLGRSIGTPAGGITAQVLVVNDFADLRAHGAQAKEKIVLFDHHFDTSKMPFDAYGDAVIYRFAGADSAAAFGAVAALVRSVTPHSLSTPHTGAMGYGDTTARAHHIPAAAITLEDADMLHRMQNRGQQMRVTLSMEAHMLPEAHSRNVIAEVRGSEHPDEVIVLGGHIDSWDVGQGAMDDGGGVVAAWEAVRLIKQLGLRPKRTIRVVAWVNEEMGGRGGVAYRDAHRAELPKTKFALESDNGVFAPRGFRLTGPDSLLPVLQQLIAPLARIGVTQATMGDPEADVTPLAQAGVPALALDIDASRYFWYHHTDADMMSALDPHEIALCVATMGVVVLEAANR